MFNRFEANNRISYITVCLEIVRTFVTNTDTYTLYMCQYYTIHCTTCTCTILCIIIESERHIKSSNVLKY